MVGCRRGCETVDQAETPVDLAPPQQAVDAGAHLGDALLGGGVVVGFTPCTVAKHKWFGGSAESDDVVVEFKEGIACGEFQVEQYKIIGGEFVGPGGEECVVEGQRTAPAAAEVKSSAVGNVCAFYDATLAMDLKLKEIVLYLSIVLHQCAQKEFPILVSVRVVGAEGYSSAPARRVEQSEMKFCEVTNLQILEFVVGRILDLPVDVVKQPFSREVQLKAVEEFEDFFYRPFLGKTKGETPGVAVEACHEARRQRENGDAGRGEGVRGIRRKVVDER